VPAFTIVWTVFEAAAVPPFSRFWTVLLVLVTVYSPAATALFVLPEIAASTMDPVVPAAI